MQMSHSLTCLHSSTSNCEQTGKRTVKRWQIGMFSIISSEILRNEIKVKPLNGGHPWV